MRQVLCTLPNCSENIGGVAFAPVEGGMLSEPISDEAAARFCSIPGYVVAPSQPDKKEDDSRHDDGGVAEGDTDASNAEVVGKKAKKTK